MQSNLMGLTMQGLSFYSRLSAALDFTVAIPAVLFFRAAGLLRRQATILSYVLGIELGSLGLASAVFGPHRIFYQIANVSIIAALVIVVARSVRQKADDQDLVVIRRGGVIFVAFILWENIRSVLGLWSLPNIEPIGFVAFLAALGYVAARQTLERDRELGEIQKELQLRVRSRSGVAVGCAQRRKYSHISKEWFSPLAEFCIIPIRSCPVVAGRGLLRVGP